MNNAVFKTDAPLESINGSANGISGTVSFDAENPAATTGKIVVSSESLTVPNPMMKEHLHSDKWLDVAKHTEITFEVKSLANVKTEGNVTTADVTGTFTLHGVAKEMTVPIKLTYLKGKLKGVNESEKVRDQMTIVYGYLKDAVDGVENVSDPKALENACMELSQRISQSIQEGDKK